MTSRSSASRWLRLPALGAVLAAAALLAVGPVTPESDAAELPRAAEQPWYAGRANIVPLGRFRDDSPFYGGSRIVSAGASQSGNSKHCTAGFTALSTKNQQRYVLTAAHCIINLKDRRFWSVGQYSTVDGKAMGTAYSVDIRRDIAYINTSAVGKTASTRIWDSSDLNSTASKDVIGVSWEHGDRDCVSGSFSGTRCGAKVVVESLPGADFVMKVTHRDRQFLARHGDSGAPYFQFEVNSSGQPNGMVSARGIVSAGDTSDRAPCPDNPNIWCYRTIYVIKLWRLPSTDLDYAH